MSFDFDIYENNILLFDKKNTIEKNIVKDKIEESNLEVDKNNLSDFETFDDQHDFVGKIKYKRKRTVSDASTLKKKDKDGKKFLFAANINNLENVKYFLNLGIDPNYCDFRGRTALHFAACKGHVQIAQQLLTYGSDPNKKDLVGNTPLHLAACTNHIKLVTLLLKSGASINTLNNSGSTPLNLAKSKLKVFQDCTSYNCEQLKEGAKQVIEMMQIYLTRSGKIEQLIVLNQLVQRLDDHITKDEVDKDLVDLMKNINNLNIK